MPTVDIERIKAYGRRFADGFTPGQKAMTILGVVGVVLAGMWFMRWASATEYAALYTDLDPADAGEVTDQLESQGIDYRLEDGGRTILVPRDDVYKTRVDLSAQGLPSGGGDSYALLDEGGITKDEFSKRVDYQRALQGELARTIGEIDGIRAADVKLTVPQERVFVGGDEDKPTAAVLVDTGTTTLPGETVQAIVHLVSSSVADMSPGDVTVADAQGNVLAAPGKTSDLALGEQHEQRSRYEESLAASLKNLITTSLGPNRAAVTVSADLDFSERKTTTTRFEQPNDIQVPISESTKAETFRGPGSGAAGVLGPDGTPLAPGSDEPVDYSNTQAERDFALDRIEETRNDAPGTVERLSVSVLLDSDAVDAGDVQLWQDALAAAAGIDVERGDQLEVQRVAFDEEARDAAAEQLKAAESAQSQNQLLDIVRSVVTLLIVALVLFLAWRAIKRSEANRVPLRVPLDLRELEAAELGLPAAVEGAALPEPSRRIEPPPIPAETEVAELIERQPEEVAQTLRSWLADRRS